MKLGSSAYVQLEKANDQRILLILCRQERGEKWFDEFLFNLLETIGHAEVFWLADVI